MVILADSIITTIVNLVDSMITSIVNPNVLLWWIINVFIMPVLDKTVCVQESSGKTKWDAVVHKGKYTNVMPVSFVAQMIRRFRHNFVA